MMSKFNVFVSLIGLIILATSSYEQDGSLVGLQCLILALGIAHFSFLITTHIKTAPCHTSLGWRVFLCTLTVMKLAVIGLAMYMSISGSSEDDQVGWYLYVSAGFALLFFLCEVVRTCKFAQEAKQKKKAAAEVEEAEKLVESATAASDRGNVERAEQVFEDVAP